MILANITIPLVGLVDTAVMGRMPEPAYLGAVVVGATIFSAIYWIFGFLRMGTTGLIAQAMGRRQTQELSAVTLRALTVAVGLGVLVIVLQLPLSLLVFWIFDASASVETMADVYFSIRIWGAPALMVYMVVTGVLFGTQRMRAALALGLLLNLTNVALDILFVIGFGWGVAGVAVATIVSEWFAAVLGLVIVSRQLKVIGWDGRRPSDLWQRDRLANLFNVSGNLIVRSFFVQFPFFTFTVVGASLGDMVLAANAIIMQLFFTMAFGLDGLAHTAETLTGFAFGAGDKAGLRSAMLYSLGWAVLMAFGISIVFLTLGGFFVSILTQLPEVRAAAVDLLPWAVAAPLVSVWAFHFDGVFIGTTRTAELRNTMFVAALLYLIVLAISLDRLGNQGLWIAMTAFLGIRGVLLALQYPKIERLTDESLNESAAS